MNAAQLYRQAFALISEEDGKACFAIKEDQITPPSDDVLALVERGRPGLEELHRAADLAECDWGLPLSQAGFFEAMQVHSKARQLAALAYLRARVAFQARRDGQALNDLLALMAMARHVGMGRFYVCGLVQFAIEQIVIRGAAPAVPRQDQATLEVAMARIDGLPASLGLSDAARAEKAYFLDTYRAEVDKLTPVEIPNYLGSLHAPTVAEAILAHTEGHPTRLLELLDSTGPAFDELAEIYSRPFDQIEPAVVASRAAYAATNPLALSILEQSERMRPAWEKAVADRALFRAALAIAAGGTGQHASVHDPFGTGPFRYRPLDGGFELMSQYEVTFFDGAKTVRLPASLIVGSTMGAGWRTQSPALLAPLGSRRLPTACVQWEDRRHAPGCHAFLLHS
jgi:hypothetical protein